MDDIDLAQERMLKEDEARLKRHLRPVMATLAGETRWCLDCDRVIPPPRLEIYPETQRCVACQARLETKYK